MVDYQENLEGWLEDTTLFPNEPFNVLFNFDDLISTPKANNEVEPISCLSDLGLEGDGWLDEKVDLSIFDYPNGLLIHPNEAEMLIVDDAATILESLMDTSFNTTCLPLDSSIDNTDANKKFTQNFDEIQAGASLDSPVPAEDVNVDVNPYSPISCISSPTPSIDSGVTSDSSVSVTPCNSTKGFGRSSQQKGKSLNISEDVNIEEIIHSIKRKKFTGDDKKIPSVRVSLKQSFHPYSSRLNSSQPKKENRYERKKVQNKEAAARYRVKKRVEEQELSDVVTSLESHQNELQEKHDQLQKEIKYLKSLMVEMFKAKGILK